MSSCKGSDSDSGSDYSYRGWGRAIDIPFEVGKPFAVRNFGCRAGIC